MDSTLAILGTSAFGALAFSFLADLLADAFGILVVRARINILNRPSEHQQRSWLFPMDAVRCMPNPRPPVGRMDAVW